MVTALGSWLVCEVALTLSSVKTQEPERIPCKKLENNHYMHKFPGVTEVNVLPVYIPAGIVKLLSQATAILGSVNFMYNEAKLISKPGKPKRLKGLRYGVKKRLILI